VNGIPAKYRWFQPFLHGFDGSLACPGAALWYGMGIAHYPLTPFERGQRDDLN
jgi:hypothetical protein